MASHLERSLSIHSDGYELSSDRPTCFADLTLFFGPLMKCAGSLVFVIILLAVIACSDETGSPQQQIEALIEQAEAAAEAKDIGTLRDLVSTDYSDARGYDKRAVTALLRLYLFRNRDVYLYSLIKSIDLNDNLNGSAQVLVAMAGQPVEEPDQLFDIRAEVMFFDLALIRAEDVWRVIGATWERAGVEDFLPD